MVVASYGAAKTATLTVQRVQQLQRMVGAQPDLPRAQLRERAPAKGAVDLHREPQHEEGRDDLPQQQHGVAPGLVAEEAEEARHEEADRHDDAQEELRRVLREDRALRGCSGVRARGVGRVSRIGLICCETWVRWSMIAAAAHRASS